VDFVAEGREPAKAYQNTLKEIQTQTLRMPKLYSLICGLCGRTQGTRGIVVSEHSQRKH